MTPKNDTENSVGCKNKYFATKLGR